MKTIQVQVDPNGCKEPMRNILGMNNGPTIDNLKRSLEQQKIFAQLKPACVRFHDAALENPGFELVDVSRIFPLFHLDENDPQNYQFKDTDDYLLQFAKYPIEFRLGESIDHSGFHRRSEPPADVEKWARICVNILRHYIDGWGDGLHLNIIRAAIYEEPDTVPNLFTGKPEQYYEMFSTTYRLIREAYPDLSIGGPNCSIDHLPFLEGFLAHCKREQTEPDFLSTTVYRREVDGILETVSCMERLVKKYDLQNTEISLSEWNNAPYSWSGDIAFFGKDYNGYAKVENAAFASSCMIRMMDTSISYAYFYSWSCMQWKVVSPQEFHLKPWPVYFGLQYCAELMDCQERLHVRMDAADDVAVLAGKTENGTVKLLISAYHACGLRLLCRADNFAHCAVKAIDAHNWENHFEAKKKDAHKEVFDITGLTNVPFEEYRPYEYHHISAVELMPDSDGFFEVALPSGGSGVFLLEFSN